MKLLGAGDNVADRYLDQRTLYPGGNAVNVAVFAARLGVQSAYLGVVGNDGIGRHLLDCLNRENVDTSLVTIGTGPNATADVKLRGNDRVFLRSDRTTALFELDETQLTAMGQFDVVHTGYAGTLLPEVARIAQRSRVSFDFGSRYDLDAIQPSLKHLWLASFSASHLTAAEAEDLARAATAAGAQQALVTRGADGAYFSRGSETIHQPAEFVTVLDTLGAGDAFISNLIVGLGSRRDVREVLVAASAHAARVCLEHGAFGYGMRFTPTKNDTKVVQA